MAASLLLGVLCVQRLPLLPPPAVVFALCAFGLVLWCGSGLQRLGGALLVGLGIASGQGALTMSQRLPHAMAGAAWLVEGRVLGLPLATGEAVRFDLEVTAGEGAAASLVGSKLRLGWYGKPGEAVPVPDAGSLWQMAVELRRPRGLVNPGGFDFERRALEQRIAATGHVLASPAPRQLADASGLDALRQRLSARITRDDPAGPSRFVAALALGDTRGLDDRDWEVLRATGLTHLIAISGFHVGLVAGFGALLGQALFRFVPWLGRRWPRPQGSAAVALAMAAGYTALAGFALPTVRTLLMIAVVLLARLARRPQGLAQSLALALLAVLVADPLCVLAPGFWLSFMGVAWLAWCLPQARESPPLATFVQAQGVAMLGLLPLGVWFFSQASLPGPVVNLVGIPWISLGVVPVALLGLAVLPVSTLAAAACWRTAGEMMQLLWKVMAWVADWPAALVWLPEPGLAATALALCGAFWLMLPRGVPGKPLAALWLLPLLWPAPSRLAHGEVEIEQLDVGQGLAVLVRTRRHVLLYDAGPATARGLDLGESVVLPALRARGVHRLDRLLLSHGDNDHAGGAAAVQRAMAPARVLAPAGWAGPGMQPCEAGSTWRWDGVVFTLLHPTAFFPYLRNDSSCVLHIRARGASALFPGDIGRHVEARLAKLPHGLVRADLLLVPHHGSDSSSSLDFLAAVRPRLALLATGHGNRFGLPKPVVLARYDRYGVRLLDSADSGAITLRLGPGGMQVRERRRQDRPRYWRDAGPGGSGYAIGSHEPDR